MYINLVYIHNGKAQRKLLMESTTMAIEFVLDNGTIVVDIDHGDEVREISVRATDPATRIVVKPVAGNAIVLRPLE